ncbi:hypothetical protein OROGR_028589 [Orobanche gracilis]
MQFSKQFSFWVIRKQPLCVNTRIRLRTSDPPLPRFLREPLRHWEEEMLMRKYYEFMAASQGSMEKIRGTWRYGNRKRVRDSPSVLGS